jgi:anti-anti-sigma factor
MKNHHSDRQKAQGSNINKPTVVSIWVAGGIAYLTIRGRLVAGPEVCALRDAVLLAELHFDLLVVNLRDVEKLDAAGLSALVFAYSTAKAFGARFRLAAVSPRIRKVLAITRLDTILLQSEPASGVLFQ